MAHWKINTCIVNLKVLCQGQWALFYLSCKEELERFLWFTEGCADSLPSLWSRLLLPGVVMGTNSVKLQKCCWSTCVLAGYLSTLIPARESAKLSSVLQALLRWDPLHGKLVAEPGADLKSSPFTSLLQYVERQIHCPASHKQVPGRFSGVRDFFSPCFPAAESPAAAWAYLVLCCAVALLPALHKKWKWKSSWLLKKGEASGGSFSLGSKWLLHLLWRALEGDLNELGVGKAAQVHGEGKGRDTKASLDANIFWGTHTVFFFMRSCLTASLFSCKLLLFPLSLHLATGTEKRQNGNDQRVSHFLHEEECVLLMCMSLPDN